MGSCLLRNVFEKMTPRRPPPGSAAIPPLKKFNPWVPELLPSATILAKVPISFTCLYETVSLQVNQGAWTDLRYWGEGKDEVQKEKRKSRQWKKTSLQELVKSNCAPWKFSPCHWWPFATGFQRSLALLSILTPPFYLKDSQQYQKSRGKTRKEFNPKINTASAKPFSTAATYFMMETNLESPVSRSVVSKSKSEME